MTERHIEGAFAWAEGGGVKCWYKGGWLMPLELDIDDKIEEGAEAPSP